jgi:hypothetical protein
MTVQRIEAVAVVLIMANIEEEEAAVEEGEKANITREGEGVGDNEVTADRKGIMGILVAKEDGRKQVHINISSHPSSRIHGVCFPAQALAMFRKQGMPQ